MARVICTLEHASEVINGVRFTPDRGQMVSDEIGDEQAAVFASIPGFLLVGAPNADVGVEADVAAQDAALMAALAYVTPHGFHLQRMPEDFPQPPAGYMLVKLPELAPEPLPPTVDSVPPAPEAPPEPPPADAATPAKAGKKGS